MSYKIGLHPSINLYVEDKIASEDATRQMRTAREILTRFEDQAGVILADEVGMGKTFVALAVAASVALDDPDQGPVVIMLPSSVREKWPRDLEVFRENCVSPEAADRLNYEVATRAVQFLKFLDDPPERRKSIVFVTHGAMSQNLADPFAKLALLRQALKYRRDTDKVRRALGRFAGDLLRLGWLEKRAPGILDELLRKPPNRWRRVLERYEVQRPDDNWDFAGDDPVPEALQTVLPTIDTDPLYEALCQIPLRENQTYKARITKARRAINTELRNVWREAVQQIRLRLPLVILDEAHHAKNAGTQLASLFEAASAEEDADEVTGGALGGTFERMLFMTATPFQLGHDELCNVLQRFEGLAWDSPRAPAGGPEYLQQSIDALRGQLDSAQESAVRLEELWGRLGPEDLQADGELYEDVDTWWAAAQQAQELSDKGRQALHRAQLARERLVSAEAVLKQWVIRHTRPRQLPEPYYDVSRRQRIVGEGIRTVGDEVHAGLSSLPGIPVQGDPALPFLLAARLVSCTPESRPVFAEGLASSYEAFLDTRRNNREGRIVDQEDTLPARHDPNTASRWYLERISEVVGHGADGRMAVDHPKLGATVDCALDLWRKGEKALIFVHYIATGRALREAISARMYSQIEAKAAEQLEVSRDVAFNEMSQIGDRLNKDAPAGRACNHHVKEILQEFPGVAGENERIQKVVLRFLKRPSFIVRYFDLTNGTITPDEVDRAFDAPDASGLTFRKVVWDFIYFLERRCGQEERNEYLQAVESIQTGAHYGDEAVEAEADEKSRRAFLGNVRLINGATKHDTRQRLMLAFNTPFYPEILVTSSVMAEGVDLHLNCRHIIHHDLAWNPSNLEQRTGRVDRIGAKAERAGRPIHVYMPYIAETQDEKMYRVVMDRERWFNIVMGGRIVTDARTAERLAERIPLPDAAKESLMLNLTIE